jgi:hypothetical protein
MEPSRWRLMVEGLGAGVIGLAPWALDQLQDLASSASSVPHFVARGLYVAKFVTGPGFFVGNVLGMLVSGFFTSDLQSMDRISVRLGLAANMLALAALWLMVRTGSRQSLRWRLAVALMTVWLVFSLPFGVFGSMWMTF